MFIHTCDSAPKMFAKFGCQTQTFFYQKRKKNGQPLSMGKTDYRLKYLTLHLPIARGGGGGGGGTQVQRGAAPSLRISRKKGSFFMTSACPRFCKIRVLFCTQVRSLGSKSPYNPRNIRDSDTE